MSFHVFVGTEPVTYRCSIDVNSFASAIGCSSPWLIKDPSAGSHTVYIWARDTAGNISAPASRSFKVVIKATEGEEGPPKEEGGSGGATPGTSTSTGSTGGMTTQGIAPAIDAKAVVKTRLLGKSTVFRKLALKGLPAGAKVGATCKGKGCPFKRKQVAVVNGVASLTALFAKHALAAGRLIELKVSAPGMTGQTIDIKTRAGKAPRVTKS